MKVKSVHRITALTMALLMCFTSVGYSVDFHYCKGDLKSFSVVGEATTCHGTMKSCPRHVEMQIEEKSEDSSCCSNETIIIDNLDADFNVSPDVELTDIQVKFVSAFVYTFNDFSLPKVVKSSFFEKHNPLPPRDIYVLLERFLI